MMPSYWLLATPSGSALERFELFRGADRHQLVAELVAISGAG